MGRGRGLAVAVVLAVVISACGSTSSGEVAKDGSADDTAGSPALPFQIQNQGGSLEGHTPRGFAGSGTGLFAGDNLNQGFPNGGGVQSAIEWVTPELSAT